jgi:N-acetylmuramoyl-L-alanine amidase
MNYKIDHIPKSREKRPATKMVATTITIHNTANPKSTAKNERGWLTNEYNNRYASYHIVVDEKEAIEVIPFNEIAYHAGDKQGNLTSIGIEICESGDYNKTMVNAVKLIADLLTKLNMATKNLRQHHDWSGKNCPRLIRAGHLGWTWQKFIDEINKELEKRKPVEKIEEPKEVSSWAKTAQQFVIVNGISDGKRPRDRVTRQELWVMLERALK